MESNKRYAAPFPDLPDELLGTHVVPRLPWYARPVCRAVSKSWRAIIDESSKRPEIVVKSRQHLLPLLQGQFLITSFDYLLFISENVHKPHEGRSSGNHGETLREEMHNVCNQWRKLPSPQEYLSPPPNYWTVIASGGMLYAWSNQKHEDFVQKIDLAGGDWFWSKISVPYPFNARAVPYDAKIYVPGVWVQGDSAETESQAVLVHDMMDDRCAVIKMWNRDNLRVLSTKVTGASLEGNAQELYSFVKHELSCEPELEILVYDACEDSWRTKDLIPLPDNSFIEDIELVNVDCFEPAPDGGINIVCIDSIGEVLSWFNTSLRKGWIDFNYNGSSMDKRLEQVQVIHGQVYGMFEDRDCQEEKYEGNREMDGEKEEDSCLLKRTIMKGTMVVKTKNVHWEEVIDVGSCIEAYYLRPTVVSPIEQLTAMA